VQAFSHWPQLLLSWRSVHTHVPMLLPEHLNVPGGHPHDPLVQMTFGLQSYVHEWPQFPQLLMSDAVSIHVPLTELLGHSMTMGSDESHVHWEAVQVPSPQAWPQAPQFRESVSRSTHVHPVTWLLGHITTVGEALHVHWEAVQVPSPHVWPQAPQLSGSAVTSTHDDPHTVWPQSELDALQAARITRRTLARIRGMGGLFGRSHFGSTRPAIDRSLAPYAP
jgi:hypothetical protein